MKTGIIIISTFAFLTACTQKREAETEIEPKSFFPKEIRLTEPRQTKEDSILDAGPKNFIDLSEEIYEVLIKDKVYYAADDKQLEALLKKHKAIVQDRLMVILAGDKTTNKRLVNVLDMMKISGIAKYSIVNARKKQQMLNKARN